MVEVSAEATLTSLVYGKSEYFIEVVGEERL